MDGSKGWRSLLVLALLILAAVTPHAQGSSADTATQPWSSPAAIVTALNHAARPALLYTNDGTAHAVWESNGSLFYASRPRNGSWGPAARIAFGCSPAMVADATGTLHVVFANQFMGNYEIYYIRRQDGTWTLPVNVSHTSGTSGSPVLALTSDNTLYAAWMDNTPGYWTIYYGSLRGQFWTSEPVPHGRGESPTLTARPGGGIYLSWQDRFPGGDNSAGRFDILLSELTNDQWALPINISDTPDVESQGVHITATPNGLAHLIWIEAGKKVIYSYGTGDFWAVPQLITETSFGAHGPRILADASGTLLYAAWDEGAKVRVTAAPIMSSIWPKASPLPTTVGSFKDVVLALIPQGGVAVAWVQASGPTEVGVFESRQVPEFLFRYWLPTTGR